MISTTWIKSLEKTWIKSLEKRIEDIERKDIERKLDYGPVTNVNGFTGGTVEMRKVVNLILDHLNLEVLRSPEKHELVRKDNEDE